MKDIPHFYIPITLDRTVAMSATANWYLQIFEIVSEGIYFRGNSVYSGTREFKLPTRVLIYQYGDIIIYIYILDRELVQCRLLK